LQNRAWSEVFDEVWNGDDSRGYTFKKSHSLSYAMLVVLHMNLLDEINPAS
jgi:DNA polymerase III alpha subunit